MIVICDCPIYHSCCAHFFSWRNFSQPVPPQHKNPGTFGISLSFFMPIVTLVACFLHAINKLDTCFFPPSLVKVNLWIWIERFGIRMKVLRQGILWFASIYQQFWLQIDWFVDDCYCIEYIQPVIYQAINFIDTKCDIENVLSLMHRYALYHGMASCANIIRFNIKIEQRTRTILDWCQLNIELIAAQRIKSREFYHAFGSSMTFDLCLSHFQRIRP